jgi:hypothetical protein
LPTLKKQKMTPGQSEEILDEFIAVQISRELGSAITETQHNLPFGFLRGGQVGHSEVLLLMDAV